MPTRALVLGGGGPIGVGWEAGLVAGLEEEGVRVTEADFILGTSAGAIIGAQLALGRPAQDLLATQLARREDDRSAPARSPEETVEMLRNFARWLSSDGDPETVRREIGAFALSARTVSEEEWLPTFGTMHGLGSEVWPERFACTTVDAESGTFIVWDHNAGVPLGLAVASSSAVPGYFPPVTIDGHRYIDGGMRSATNADFARGYDQVLIVAPSGVIRAAVGRSAGIAEGIRCRFEAQLDALRGTGSAFEVVLPDQASLEAFGPNLLDASRRRQAAEAGERQGREEAARIREFWG